MQGNGQDYQGSVNVGQISAINEHKVLHLALTESHIPESWYGGDEINFVTRLMIPNQYGTPLLGKPSFDFEFSVDPVWETDNCELVAFIQDTITKEIFQAKSFLLSEATLTYYDVALDAIILPATEFCQNEIAPSVRIKNQSFENLVSCLITYNINNEVHEYNWTGELDPDSTLQVELPAISFTLLDENNLSIDVNFPNGHDDEYPDNNTLDISFSKAPLIQSQTLTLELQTDNFGAETSFEIRNSEDVLIYFGDEYTDNTLYSIDLEFNADDCYTLRIFDTGGNGICCENGNGYFKLKDSDNNIYFEGGDFDSFAISNFQIDLATKKAHHNLNEKYLAYPNPACNSLNLIFSLDSKKIEVYNLIGDIILSLKVDNETTKQLDLSQYPPGQFIIKITGNKGVIQSINKIVICK